MTKEKEEGKLNTIQDKYNWKLTDLFQNKEQFYNAVKKLQNDLKQIETYKGILCDTSDNLYQCYALYEKSLISFDKIYSYGMFSYHLNMADQEGIKLFKEVENLSSEFGTATSFMTPEITFTKEELINKYLSEDERLKPYERDIRDILEDKRHILSKEEENLLAKYSEVFSGPENIYDILTNAEFKFGTLIDEQGNEVELTDATYTKYLKSNNMEVRKQAFQLMYKKYSEYINTITEMYLANVKQTVITARLRKYNSSLEKATDQDDSTIKVYEALMKGVNEGLEINHEFISLKKKLLNLKELHMYDLYVNPYQENKDKISFEEAKQEVKTALAILGEEYGKLLDEAFEHNWIDVYEKPNKRGGAYSSGVYGVHPFVLMSFTEDKRDVSTIAHELGHSMHSYYSNKNQNIINSGYTIMVAEVASTVNEILLSEYQIQNEKDKKKKAEYIYEFSEMIRATFYRQSMFAEFEKEVHEKIENGGMLSAEDLNKIYYELNQKYFGKDIIIDKEIQYEWSRIPHFYTDFYVYKYATGISAAICIATKILNKEEGFVEKYINMLSQGCMKKSVELLKMVDVDLEDSNTYKIITQFYKDKISELKDLI